MPPIVATQRIRSYGTFEQVAQAVSVGIGVILVENGGRFCQGKALAGRHPTGKSLSQDIVADISATQVAPSTLAGANHGYGTGNGRSGQELIVSEGGNANHGCPESPRHKPFALNHSQDTWIGRG